MTFAAGVIVGVLATVAVVSLWLVWMLSKVDQ